MTPQPETQGLPRRTVQCAVVGALVAVLAYAQTFFLWSLVYSRSTWVGYEIASSRGLVRPHWSNSPRASLLMLCMLIVLGLILGFWTPRFSALLSTSLGFVGSAWLLELVSWSPVLSSNLGPPSLVLYLPACFLGLLAGWLPARFMVRLARRPAR